MKKLICILISLCTITFIGCSNNSNENLKPKDTSKAVNLQTKKDSSKKDVSNSTNKKEAIPSKDASKSNDSSKDVETIVNNLSKEDDSNNENTSNSEKVNPETVKESPSISESEIMNLINNGEQALRSIFKGSAYYSKNIIIKNDVYYGEVTDFNSREEMADSLKPYFTNETINSLLDKYLITEDGKLYFTIGDAGRRVNYADSQRNIEYNENQITVTFSRVYSENDIGKEVKTLQLIDGKWLFTNFWYV